MTVNVYAVGLAANAAGLHAALAMPSVTTGVATATVRADVGRLASPTGSVISTMKWYVPAGIAAGSALAPSVAENDRPVLSVPRWASEARR